MQGFDPRSVIIAAAIVNLFFAAILLALYKNFLAATEGLREASLAAFSVVIGGTLIGARDFIPAYWSIIFGNAFLIGGFLISCASFSKLCLGHFRHRYFLIAAEIIFVLLLWLSFRFGSYTQSVMLASLVITIIFASCAAVMWRMESISFAAGFTGFMFFLGAMVSATRFITLAAGAEQVTKLFDPAPVQKFYLILLTISLIGVFLGFIVMLYEKLRKVMLQTTDDLEHAIAIRTADLRTEIARTIVLEREIASTAEEERRRIGSELHDDLGQRLTGISLAAEALARALQRDCPLLAEPAAAIVAETSEAICLVRRLAHGLMPIGPGQDAFEDAMKQLISSVSSLSDISCKFDYDEPIEIENKDVAINLFRIGQEALTNTIRHGKATEILFRLDLLDGKLVFSIVDNGIGFDLPAVRHRHNESGAGSGLNSMRFRASLINFRFQIDASPGNGTAIQVIEC